MVCKIEPSSSHARGARRIHGCYVLFGPEFFNRESDVCFGYVGRDDYSSGCTGRIFLFGRKIQFTRAVPRNCIWTFGDVDGARGRNLYRGRVTYESMDHLEEVRKLIRENILPRLDNLDAEMHELRRVTWPVCQGQRDATAGGPLTNIPVKSRFLKFMHLDDVRDLLSRKAIYMGIYSQEIVNEELRQIIIINN